MQIITLPSHKDSADYQGVAFFLWKCNNKQKQKIK